MYCKYRSNKTDSDVVIVLSNSNYNPWRLRMGLFMYLYK